MNSTNLEGKKTYIRLLSRDDTDLIVKWRNQENVKKYFFYREVFTKEIHENWINTKIDTGNVVQFIIVLKDGDIPIGSTYLRDIDYEEGSAEYGVFIGEEAVRGQGIGKEVLALTLDYAWNALGLNKIIARAISTNAASIYSFLNLGFSIVEKVDNVKCSDGELADMVMMSINRN